MIGIEFISKLFDVQYKGIAEELGISKQTINSWVSGARKIPSKHLAKLSETFDIPEEYFQKELNEKDKLEIQISKLKNETGISDLRELFDNDDSRINGKSDLEVIDIAQDEIGKILETVEEKFAKLILDEIKKQLNSNGNFNINLLIYEKIISILNNTSLDKDGFYRLLMIIEENPHHLNKLITNKIL